MINKLLEIAEHAARLSRQAIASATPEDVARTRTGSVLVTDARVRYGTGDVSFEALRGVSLEARPGEVMMIRGPSGSGKTTLLQLMGALKQPTSGEVLICGKSTEGLSVKELRHLRATDVGFVFQSFNLFPTLKAWENVAVALDLVGWDRRAGEKRSREILATLGLAERADHLPSKLSGGQRQRVAIARALAHNPPVILADEPTASLDGASGTIVIETLRMLAHEHNRVVVIVSHDSRIEPYVDVIVNIEDGLLSYGTPHAHERGFAHAS